jgi:hypothetical protein
MRPVIRDQHPRLADDQRKVDGHVVSVYHGARDRMAAVIVRATDEQAAHAHAAHRGEGDLLRAGAGLRFPRVSREDHQDQSDYNK